MKEQTPHTNELGSDAQSQFGLHKNHTPQNLIINVAPPEEEMHLGFNESQEDGNEGGMSSPQKQRGLGRGAPRQEEPEQPSNQKVQSFHYNIAPKVSTSH